MRPEPKVDLTFQVIGQNLTVDHGYTLYASMCRVLPDLHDDGDCGIGLIRGRYVGEGVLDISPRSELVASSEPTNGSLEPRGGGGAVHWHSDMIEAIPAMKRADRESFRNDEEDLACRCVGIGPFRGHPASWRSSGTASPIFIECALTAGALSERPRTKRPPLRGHRWRDKP